MCDFTEDQTTEFKEVRQLFDGAGDGLYLYHRYGNVMRVLGQNPNNTKLPKVLGNSKNEGMGMEVLDFERFLPMLQIVTKNS